jgi:hypothetical protein
MVVDEQDVRLHVGGPTIRVLGSLKQFGVLSSA